MNTDELKQQVAGAAVAMHERSTTLERAESVLKHAEIGVTFGLVDGPRQ